MGYFIRLSDSSESSIPIMRRKMISRRGKVDSGRLVRSLVGSNPRVAVTAHRVGKVTGEMRPRVQRGVLDRLQQQKYLLKVGSVYYVNPNQPSAVSPLYWSR